MAYDATTGVRRDYYLSSEAPEPRGSGESILLPKPWEREASRLRVDVTKGLPLGPPDVWSIYSGADLSAAAATALALQAGGKATLEATSLRGRPVWVISLSGGLAGPLSTDPDETALITIDRQTCLPTRFQAVQDGVLKLEMAWRNVRIDEP
jgi:hypothetical protein